MSPHPDDMPPLPARRITVREIVAAVAAVSGMPANDITGRRCFARLVLARWAAMRIARESGRSLSQIGRVVRRDHTTVINGLRESRQISNRRPEHARWLADVERRARHLMRGDPVPEPQAVPPLSKGELLEMARAERVLARRERAERIRRRGGVAPDGSLIGMP